MAAAVGILAFGLSGCALRTGVSGGGHDEPMIILRADYEYPEDQEIVHRVRCADGWVEALLGRYEETRFGIKRIRNRGKRVSRDDIQEINEAVSHYGRLGHIGLFLCRSLTDEQYDSRFTLITVTEDEEERRLETWHEIHINGDRAVIASVDAAPPLAYQAPCPDPAQ